MKEAGTALGGCLLAIILIFISPLFSFAIGYLVGLILSWCIGNTVANGMNILFDTTRFTPDLLPIVCGALGTVGSFFRTTTTRTKE